MKTCKHFHICTIKQIHIKETYIQHMTHHVVSESCWLKLSQLRLYKESQAISDVNALFKAWNQTT